ncbi:MAG: hypothetical protein GY832_40790 [Chloroflexi bacterium]|nr:hypothetical protein [Chloroflexota bacterium]
MSNIPSQIFSLLVLAAICLFCSTCSCESANSIDPQGIQSIKLSLSTALVQKSDFSGDWYWSNDHISEPNFETDSNAEVTFRGLAGFYDSEQFYLITHWVRRYDQPMAWKKIQSPRQDSQDEFPINTILLGSSTESWCTQEVSSEHTILECHIVVEYNYVTSHLKIYMIDQVDIQMVEVVVNEILTKIDNRIKEIDGPTE